jgi:glycosyltransferase involved in cell wall biosynthesis
MRCPTLKELPPPPPGKVGWPWTEESPPLPDTMPDGRPWPRVSIVTPSYNQGQFIEETLRSVLLQGYPNLEYIVMDGGSTDGSVEILKRYSHYFDYWVSRKDEGHAAAIRSGFDRATGTILGFLNSDDILLPSALGTVALFFSQHPTVELVVGKSLIIGPSSEILRAVCGYPPTFYSLLFWGSGGFYQPASFWSMDALQKVGMFDTSLRFAFDYDLYLRLTRHQKARRVNAYLAAFRVHPKSKTSMLQDVKREEDAYLQKRYGIERFPPLIRRIAWYYYHMRYLLFAGFFRLRVLLKLENVPSAL